MGPTSAFGQSPPSGMSFPSFLSLLPLEPARRSCGTGCWLTPYPSDSASLGFSQAPRALSAKKLCQLFRSSPTGSSLGRLEEAKKSITQLPLNVQATLLNPKDPRECLVAYYQGDSFLSRGFLTEKILHFFRKHQSHVVRGESCAFQLKNTVLGVARTALGRECS